MSTIESVPSYLSSKTGEEISLRFREWCNVNRKKLLKSFPPSEKAFCKIVDKLKHKMRSLCRHRWDVRLRYTRQKEFVVAPGVVFFGDFYFSEMKILFEIDGWNHVGKAAKEKDEWRSTLIRAWKVQIVRISNDRLLNTDFREMEQWFVEKITDLCPYARKLRLDYWKMRDNNPHIYLYKDPSISL